MARPTTHGGPGVLGPRTAGAFLLGALLGVAIVVPALPAALGEQAGGVMAGGGAVIAVGVAALALLMVLLALFYQLTMS